MFDHMILPKEKEGGLKSRNKLKKRFNAAKIVSRMVRKVLKHSIALTSLSGSIMSLARILEKGRFAPD